MEAHDDIGTALPPKGYNIRDDVKLSENPLTVTIDFFKEKLKEAYTDGFNDSRYDFDTENYL